LKCLAASASSVVQLWPFGGTYWRSSSQIVHWAGGVALGGYCMPQAVQMNAFMAGSPVSFNKTRLRWARQSASEISLRRVKSFTRDPRAVRYTTKQRCRPTRSGDGPSHETSGLVCKPSRGDTTMSSIKFAAAFAVVASFAGPALAGDHDLATELQDSGRYIGQTMPGNAHASSVKGNVARHGYSATGDFQMQGR
jgi:hypothetical protein